MKPLNVVKNGTGHIGVLLDEAVSTQEFAQYVGNHYNQCTPMRFMSVHNVTGMVSRPKGEPMSAGLTVIPIHDVKKVYGVGQEPNSSLILIQGAKPLFPGRAYFITDTRRGPHSSYAFDSLYSALVTARDSTTTAGAPVTQRELHGSLL
jgi:hypothetical protein